MASEIDFFLGKILSIEADTVTVNKYIKDTGSLSVLEKLQAKTGFKLRKVNTTEQLKIGDFGICFLIQAQNKGNFIDTGYEGFFFAKQIDQWDGINVTLTNDFLVKTNGKKVIIDEGNNGGLVKVQDLVNKINALENSYNTLLQNLQSIVITLAPSGTVPFAPFVASSSPITPLTSVQDLENQNVQH
ncbi:hypothetical protein EBU91_05230 [bacterium]|nr:hypothetical protein [bacterium]